MSAVANRVAQPGAADLDFDVDGLTITAVVSTAVERMIVPRLVDGYGWWRCGDGAVETFLPGDDPQARVAAVEAHICYPMMPPILFAQLVTRLEGWRDAGTPLRMCAAPGKATTLIEDLDRWVALPRRPFRADPGRRPGDRG